MELPEKIESIYELQNYLCIFNDIVVKSFHINSLSSPFTIPEGFSIANKFPWLRNSNDLRIIIEGQYVLVKLKTLLGIPEWHYSRINFFGSMPVNYKKNIGLHEVEEIYIVEPEEYFVNTSRNYLELHPEYQNLVNPNTNDYI